MGTQQKTEKQKEKTMNENMTNESERETLVATRDTVGERYKEVCRMAIAHQKKTMEDWIERLGLGGKFQVARVNLNCGMAVTTMPDERGRTDDIEVYFRPEWDGHRTSDGAKVRSLEFSIRSTRLSVERENDLLMATVAGKFAENVAAIEADLRAFDWALFDRTERADYAAGEALRRFDEAAAKAERDRKAAEIRMRLDAGVRVNVGKPYYGAKEEEVKTVERITAKCLFFKEDYGGRTKLEEALQNLVNGTWRIAE